LHNIIAN
jgi:protein phosphatase PTC2/3